MMSYDINDINDNNPITKSVNLASLALDFTLPAELPLDYAIKKFFLDYAFISGLELNDHITHHIRHCKAPVIITIFIQCQDKYYIVDYIVAYKTIILYNPVTESVNCKFSADGTLREINHPLHDTYHAKMPRVLLTSNIYEVKQVIQHALNTATFSSDKMPPSMFVNLRDNVLSYYSSEITFIDMAKQAVDSKLQH